MCIHTFIASVSIHADETENPNAPDMVIAFPVETPDTLGNTLIYM